MRPTQTVIVGDCIDAMRAMPAASVQCCVTSPPYYGLRDYGVDGQIGLEDSLSGYVASMVAVFREVRRVLRPDGTLWLNLGDSYNSNTGGGFDTNGTGNVDRKRKAATRRMPIKLPKKNLLGIPWRVALDLQADGWWLRQDIIWHKPSPTPEAVTDRCTKAHEYVFLMTPAPQYFYDAFAIREKTTGAAHSRGTGIHPKSAEPGSGIKANKSFSAAVRDVVDDRNKRSVWKISAQGYRKAHFATYPEALVIPCVKAGTSARGCCPSCGAPWRRLVDPERRHATTAKPIGWAAGCKCGGAPVPCTVLDPFNGAGTTGVVCKRLGRSYVGVELNPKYAEMARQRIADPDALPPVPDVPGQVLLFNEESKGGNDDE